MSAEQPQESYFRFQLDILMKELDLIDQAISRLDLLLLSNRNWGVTIWTGFTAIIVAQDLEKYLLLTAAALPLLFWQIDIVWKMALLRCSDR